LELLKVIHSKYPDKFPSARIHDELDQIMQSVSISQEATSTPISTSKFSRKPHLPKPKLDLVARCQARIWDSIFERDTGKDVADVDDEFHIIDYNDIDITKFDKKYVLGKQCARKKTAVGNYCLLHSRHRPHGNYIETPSKELCLHFMIDGGYIKNQNQTNANDD
jgi:hypothetical protein